MIVKCGYKTYIKIPGGEIQYGRLTGRVVVWFRGRLFRMIPAWKVAP